MERAREQLDAFLAEANAAESRIAAAEIHSPWDPPGSRLQLPSAIAAASTRSQTVVRATVPRFRIPPPPLQDRRSRPLAGQLRRSRSRCAVHEAPRYSSRSAPSVTPRGSGRRTG
jgi:hypothetical protein